MLVLPCRSADEALSLQHPKCWGEAWPWGSILVVGGIGAFTPSCGFVGCFQEICMLHELVRSPLPGDEVEGGIPWHLHLAAGAAWASGGGRRTRGGCFS